MDASSSQRSRTRLTVLLGAGAMRCRCFLQPLLAHFILRAGIWLPWQPWHRYCPGTTTTLLLRA